MSRSLLAFAALAFAAVAIGASACHKPPPTAATASPRVVSLSPSTTETLFAVDAGAVTVGRSRFCNYPPEVAALPAVGGFVDADLEGILALRPTLVVGARGPAGDRFTKRLEALGIQTYFPRTESIGEVRAMIGELSQRAGHTADGTKLLDRLDRQLAALDGALASAPNVRVLLVFGTNPVVVAGGGTFPDEMLARAHGTNVVAPATGYPTLPAERIAALDPDVILDAVMGGDEPRVTAQTPGFASLRAVKEGHVVALRDEAVLRPGPRLPRGIAALAHAIHPSVPLPDEESSRAPQPLR